MVGENFTVHEDPVGVVAVPDTTGDTLFNVIKDVLIRLNLPIRNCRGQAYDGAVVCKEISKEWRRVQEAGPPRGGAGGAICPGPQPMKGPQNEEVKQVYKLYRERCLKNWMHFNGKMT